MKNLILLFTFLTGISFSSNAQVETKNSLHSGFLSNTEDTICINWKVGNVIDSAEKVKYRIFPYYSPKEFVSAVFIRNQDSSIVLKTRFKSDSSIEKPISWEEFVWIKNMIKTDYGNENPGLKIKKDSKKFNLSLFSGFSIGGALNDIEAQMNTSGFDDTERFSIFGVNFIGSTYPNSIKSLIFDVEAAYSFTKNGGVSLNFGLSDNVKISGYSNGNHLTLKSEIYTFSSCYILNTEDQRLNIFIGPSCLLYYIEQTDRSKFVSSDMKFIPGLYMGMSFQIVQTEICFIGLKANYRWAPTTGIGPFTSGTGKTSSEYKRTIVNLATLNFGIAIGLRFGKGK